MQMGRFLMQMGRLSPRALEIPQSLLVESYFSTANSIDVANQVTWPLSGDDTHKGGKSDFAWLFRD